MCQERGSPCVRGVSRVREKESPYINAKPRYQSSSISPLNIFPKPQEIFECTAKSPATPSPELKVALFQGITGRQRRTKRLSVLTNRHFCLAPVKARF